MYKILIITFFSFCLISCGITKKTNDFPKIIEKEVLSVATNSQEITIMFNEQSFPWQISDSKINIPYNGEINKVAFLTPIDTLRLNLPAGKTVPISIILNKTDTINSGFVGISKPVNFNSKYISENKGKYTAYSPKVHELINIVFALTNVGKKDHNMINNTTEYYSSVISFFDKYKNHSLIDSLNINMKDNTNDYYYNLKMNACMYSFNDEKRIVNNSPYKRLGWGSSDYLDEYLPLLEDFAKESEFEKFYEQNSNYYQSLINTYYKVVPLNKMWKWLENKYSERYDSYKVYFSPLVGGMHSTEYFSDNGYKETVMFVNAPIFPKEYTFVEQEMDASRVVFTEIDHNYINPISDKLLNEINSSFKNRFFWVLDDPGLNGYPTPYHIFNEYMTWSLYSLYCVDTFSKDNYNKYIKKMETVMVKKRGFVKFKEFNQKLIELYNEDKSIKMIDLVKSILEWSKQKQNSVEKK